MTVYHGSLTAVERPEIRVGESVGDFGRGFYVTSSVDQARRFYGTKFYRDLEDESTKLWTLSPEQLYLIFHAAA